MSVTTRTCIVCGGPVSILTSRKGNTGTIRAWCPRCRARFKEHVAMREAEKIAAGQEKPQ